MEVADNTYVEFFPIHPRVSNASMMVAQIMLWDGYEPRMGLGRNSDGMVTLLEVAENHGRFGLGYKPTNTDKRRITLERK